MKPRVLLAGLLALAACQSPDTTPPTIASSLPADGATDVALTAKLVLTFSEPVKPETLGVSPTPAVALGPAAWNDSRTAVFSPPGGWQAGTAYSFAVGVKDLAGNPLGGDTTLAFQTVPPPDTTPPATPGGVKATPGDGEFFVEWNPSPEPDLAGYTVYVGTAADALLPTLFVEKPAVLAKVAGLDNGKPYFYAVDAQDASGNRSAPSAVASVTPKDMVAPALVSSEPADGAQDLGLVPALRFTFSEPMDPGSVEIGLCVSTDPPASATCTAPTPVNFGTPAWGQGDTQVQFTPSDQLQSGKTHVLLISAKDKGGNPLAGPGRVAFSLRATPDTTPPTVASRSTDANPQTHRGFVQLDFSEAMDQQSVQAAFLSQPALGCAWVWTANSARCNAALQQLTTYTITLSTGAKDTAGNALAAAYQFSFTTPNFNPRLLTVSPRDGTFNVSPSSPITFTFSEAMNAASVEGALEVRIGSTIVGGSLEWNAEGTVVRFRPNVAYGYGKTVIWKITTAARELSAGRTIGLPLPAEVSGSFTTQLIIGR